MEDTPNEAAATLEKGVPVTGPSDVDEIGEEVPTGVVDATVLSPRSMGAWSSRIRLLDQLLLSTYVLPLERIHHLMGMVTSDLEGVLEIAHHWNPLNQAESTLVHMLDLYSNYFQIPVAARSE